MKSYKNHKSECKTSVYLPIDLMQYVDSLAKSRDESRSKIIQMAILLLKETQE
jgi:metal-responsive CopG/Arc/MetJ family transcriptional regulator